MKRYNEYKDSGVEWIGEIPSHWEVKKWKHITDILTDYTANGSFGDLAKNVQYLDYKDYARLVRLTDLRNGCKNEGIYVTAKAYRYLSKSKLTGGEFLIANVGAYSGLICEMPHLDEKATLGPNMMMARFNKQIDNKFMIYVGNSSYSQMQLKDRANSSSAQPKLNKDDFRSIVIVTPTLDEQKQIVKYLDKKTSQIETLISKKEELIETLKASRSKLISETVTKGIDKDVPMKDSGVEWIGEIQNHYEVKKLRYLGNLQNGISKGAEEFGFGYPFISYGDIYKNSSIPNEIEGLVNSSKEDRRIYSVIEGDVFFTRTSETIEEIGFASTCLETITDATFAGFLIRFRPNSNDLYKGYSKYYFRSDIHRKFFVKEMNLVTRASLGQNLLKNLPVVIPSYEEQIEISKYLDKQVTIINNIISKTEEQIRVFKKAKQKLITEVVTGKIDVTNL